MKLSVLQVRILVGHHKIHKFKIHISSLKLIICLFRSSSRVSGVSNLDNQMSQLSLHQYQDGDAIYPKMMRSSSSLSGPGGKLEEVIYPQLIAASGGKLEEVIYPKVLVKRGSTPDNPTYLVQRPASQLSGHQIYPKMVKQRSNPQLIPLSSAQLASVQQLSQAQLSQVQLTHAQLAQAQLSSANLAHAQLSQAQLAQVQQQQLNQQRSQQLSHQQMQQQVIAASAAQLHTKLISSSPVVAAALEEIYPKVQVGQLLSELFF